MIVGERTNEGSDVGRGNEAEVDGSSRSIENEEWEVEEATEAESVEEELTISIGVV